MNYEQFVTESNRIEGILRPPLATEIQATRAFVEGSRPTVETVSALALLFTSGEGVLRDREDLKCSHRSVYCSEGRAAYQSTSQRSVENYRER